jgi:hypothetical protein
MLLLLLLLALQGSFAHQTARTNVFFLAASL